MAQLIYETTSDAFANEALDALLKAQIPSYRTGGKGYVSSLVVPTGEDPISLFVSNEADLPRANDILRKLGAATSGTSLTEFKWLIRIIASCLIGTIIWLIFRWMYAPDL